MIALQEDSRPFESWITVPEAAELKGKNQSTVHRWTYGGHLKWRWLGKKTKCVLKSELDSFDGLPIGNPNMRGEKCTPVPLETIQKKIREYEEQCRTDYPDGIFQIVFPRGGGAALTVNHRGKTHQVWKIT